MTTTSESKLLYPWLSATSLYYAESVRQHRWDFRNTRNIIGSSFEELAARLLVFEMRESGMPYELERLVVSYWLYDERLFNPVGSAVQIKERLQGVDGKDIE